MAASAKTVAIIANGYIKDPLAIAPLVKKHSYIIAADGGLVYCDRMGVVPDFIIGDFDSAPSDLIKKYQHIPMQKCPCEKDETDLECALKMASPQDSAHTTLFGALGNRIDHELWNLHLLTRYPQKIYIETENEVVFAITKKVRIDCKPGQTISFIPIDGPTTGISTKGLKWELNHATFNKNFVSISNICLGKHVDVTIEKGDLICCFVKTKMDGNGR